MRYTIRNVSNNNVVIGKTSLRPNAEMKVENLEPLRKVIDLGYISVVEIQDNDQAIYQNYIKKYNPTPENIIIKAQEEIIQKPITRIIPETISDNFVKDKLKQNLIEGFFNYYLTKEVTENDLKMLKWFYKNIGFTSQINQETLELIDNAENTEELTEVLLNHIYPELLEQYLSKQHNEKIITT